MSEEKRKSFTKDHKFLIMVSVCIVIATILVFVSMALYYSSGAAQLDLSRPGLSGIRDQVLTQEEFEEFSATGEINSESLDEFEKMYDKNLEDIKSVDAFNGDVLSPETLQIDDKNNVQ